MEWIEIIKQISILLGIWILIYGIDAWRREHIGKRKIDLAEDTLALFYEAVDAIKYIRLPTSYNNETKEIKQNKDESEVQFYARKNASVVFYRYNQKQELFNKIHASRYRFMAQIGKEEAEPFNDLRNIINEILISARMLASLWSKKNFRTDEQWEKHQKKIDKYEAVFWEGIEKEDPINPKLEKLIKDIEKICQAVITGEGTLYALLNRRIFRKINKKANK